MPRYYGMPFRFPIEVNMRIQFGLFIYFICFGSNYMVNDYHARMLVCPSP
jgi:hypothetical protein